MRIAVTGSSGFIGSFLVPLLRTRGHEVARVVRRQAAAKDEVRWDPASEVLDVEALEGVDSVIHLAGASIAGGRWTPERKALLRSSRVVSTRTLAETLARTKRRPEVLVSVSAVGYYGNRGESWVGEGDPPGDDFLGRLAVEWEEAARPAAEAGIRVVHPRLGLVLSPAGGALRTMLLPFRLGLGGRLGSGRQFMSWIGLPDLLEGMVHLLQRRDLAGPVNMVSPTPVSNEEFTRALGRVLHRPTLLPVPAFALRLLLGEMADAALLASLRVRPDRLVATGFSFGLPRIEAALQSLVPQH